MHMLLCTISHPSSGRFIDRRGIHTGNLNSELSSSANVSICLFLESSLRFKSHGSFSSFICEPADFCSLMWCVRERDTTSCLCFPQISKCLISGCEALIHNAKAEYGSIACPESCLLLHLLSPHLLYLTGLLFSLYQSTPLHGPNSALSSCLARS